MSLSLHELERLIRRIEEAMDKPGPDGALAKMAEEYNAAARAAATRLAQCSAMQAAGDEHQALQLAETQPALLDILTLLSFRRSPQWRALCRGENLPPAESFDLKAVRRLNELYAKGIDRDHALYRDYRRAVMLNDDAQALAILRSIHRLNPSDKNAGEELHRLEHKHRVARIRRLEELVRAGPSRAAEISGLADELERSGPIPETTAWIPAQAIRAELLLNRAKEAQSSGAFADAQRELKKLAALSSFLTAPNRAAFEEIERWAAAETFRRQESANRRAAVDHLAGIAARVEQEQIGPGKRALHQLRQALDSLDRAWRQVEHFRADVPAPLAASVKKLRDSLQTELDRSVRASRRLAFASVAAIVAICIAAAFIAYSRQAANTLARRLESLISQRQVAAAESVVAALRKYPGKREAVEHGEAFIRREREAKADFEQLVARLQGAAERDFPRVSSDGNPISPRDYLRMMEVVDQAEAALPDEFKSQSAPVMDKLHTAWSAHVDSEHAKSNRFLDDWMRANEGRLDRELNYGSAPEQVARTATNFLTNHLSPIKAWADNLIPQMRPSQEVLFRFQELEGKLSKFAREATNYLDAQSLLGTTNLPIYLDAMRLLVSSGFTPAADRAAAGTVAGLNLSAESLLAPLLLAEAPGALSTPPHLPRHPDEPLPAERDLQRKLRDDENIHSISRLEIEVKALPENDPRRRRIVFLRGELQRRITRRSGQIYDPVESPNALQFAEKEFGSLEYRVEEPVPAPESELYERASLARLLDPNTGQYQASLLQALDDINRDRRASPVFRAWLFARVAEIVDVQPAQWGSIWSPTFHADRAELSRLGAGQIHSGDWFVPAHNSRRAVALNAHFERAALHSYARESAFFKRLLPKAMESGVRVIGYISAKGEPILNASGVGSRAVFGLAAADQRPTLLFTGLNANRPSQPRVKPLPFTPLFVFGGDAAELVDAALQSLGYAANAVGLPETLPPILREAP